VTKAARILRSHNHNLLLGQATLNFLGAAIGLLLSKGAIDFPVLMAAMLVVLGGLLSWGESRSRETVSDSRASACFVLGLLPVYLFVWMLQARDGAAVYGTLWTPFRHHELSVLTVALLAPPVIWMGVACILCFPLLAYIQLQQFPLEVLAHIESRPLVPIVAFSLFALGLYLFRMRWRKIACSAAEREAEVRLMKRFTNSILAIKDLANSPLQAILLDVDLLQKKHPDCAEVAGRIGKSAEKLRDLNKVLNAYRIDPTKGPLSMDSRAELRKKG
jgi:hypothetical protein